MAEQRTEAINLPPLEKSKNIYIKPFPTNTAVTAVETDSPAHSGSFRGAIDFCMPLGTPVLAPLEGEVFEVEDSNDKYGPTKENATFGNYIALIHPSGERSEVIHLAKGSAKVKQRDKVKAGQQIAETG